MKIISCCDNAYVSTGYGTAWTNILKRWPKLKSDWEFYHLGWQERARAHLTIDGFTHLPAGKLDKCYDQVFPNIMKIKPDIFITMGDVGVQAGYISQVFEAKKLGWTGKWIAWTPIDSYTWAMGWDEILSSPDINLAMAKFGENQMKQHNVQNVYEIPLGVDTEIYEPLVNRELLREKLGFKDKFVVGFVGRNQKRKMVDRLIKSFSLFSKGKDDVVLMLHSDLVPPDAPGWDLRTLFYRFSKEHDPELLTKNKIQMTKKALDMVDRQRLDEKQIAEIYNLMDVFFYLTGGEGFGMPGIECQSCGIPLIMNDCTTANELCGTHSSKVPILKDKYNRDVIEIGQNGVENKYPDDIEAAKILNQKYEKWKSKGLMDERLKARKFALNYDWNKISKDLIKLFEEI